MYLEKSKQQDWFIAHRSFNITCSSLFLKYHVPWSSSHIKDEVPQGSLPLCTMDLHAKKVPEGRGSEHDCTEVHDGNLRPKEKSVATRISQ
jgi:hypothetical protein